METMSSKQIGYQLLLSSIRSVLEKYKSMTSEEEGNSSRDSISSTDSDSSTNSSDSDSDSPPPKRHRGPLVFNSFDELVKIDAGDIISKDYFDWFMSSEAEVDESKILSALKYHEWFSTLGSEAKADVLHPSYYFGWYDTKFDQAKPLVYPSVAPLIEEYGNLALEYYNKKNKCHYEYVRDVDLNECGYSTHFNFYGRLKVPSSTPESEAPERLFFARVDPSDTVLECHLLESDEFGDASVLHPPHDYCPVCASNPLKES